MIQKTKVDYSKWRMFSLALVYLLMGLHIVHWKMAGKTLAPLEFNEVLYTIHQGIITAGFIFMGLTMLATLVAGRFFCSWMCHILALQDASVWLLNKFKIKPKHIRSRTLSWLPVVAVIYLFILPQLDKYFTGQPAVSLHMAEDSDGWASFMTNDYWRNLPGIGITLTTFIVCGGAVIYILGSRSFCQYVCPYGMLFSVADRVAPGKIILKGDCTNCGLCTAVCSSHVQVEREVNQFDRVVDPNCLKDMDCVQVCPENALSYGLTKPAGFLSWKKLKGFRKKYDFKFWEDVLLAISSVIFIFIFRGLYDSVPFLLSLTIGIILGFGLITMIRVYRNDFVRLGHYVLKKPGRITNHGRIYSILFSMMILFSIHSAFIHYHAYVGERAYNKVVANSKIIGWKFNSAADLMLISNSMNHLNMAGQYGLIQPASLDRQLAAISLLKQDYNAALFSLESLVLKLPQDLEARVKLAKLLYQQNKANEAEEVLMKLDQYSVYSKRELRQRSEAYLLLGHINEEKKSIKQAIDYYELSMKDDPDNMEACLALGVLFTRIGNLGNGEKLLQEVSNHGIVSAVIENNLGVICLQQKRFEEAEMHFSRVMNLQPGNIQVSYNLAMLQYRSGKGIEASDALKKILRQDPTHKNAREALSMIESKSVGSKTPKQKL